MEKVTVTVYGDTEAAWTDRYGGWNHSDRCQGNADIARRIAGEAGLLVIEKPARPGIY